MYNEKERFLSMYEEQVKHTIDFVESVKFNEFAKIPIETDSMFMGTRVNKINIGSLIRHLIVAENHWFNALYKVRNNEVIPIPDNASVIEGIPDSEQLLNKLSVVSREGINSVKNFSEQHLGTKFQFAGLNYTVIGFLWALYGHHAFHKGQIDLLMRQLNYLPGEYLEYNNPPLVVG